MTAFAIFWMGSAASTGAPAFFVMFGLIFVGAGLYMMASPMTGAVSASNTTYAITNKRILIVENGSTRKVQSYGPDDIQNLERREKPDGSGDIIFAREQYYTHHNGHRHARTREIGLWGIPNAREAERLIRENLKRD